MDATTTAGPRPAHAPGPPLPAARRRLPTTGRDGLDALLVLAVLLVPLVLSHHDGAAWRQLVDLTVYRDGGVSVLEGRAVYDQQAEGTGLPFTYPPVAALLAAPLGLLHPELLRWVWSLSSVAVLGWVVHRCFPALLARAAARPLLALALLVCAAAWLYPVRETLRFGQVNLLLLALVLADLTSRSPRWPRGALVGLAVAVKLTPGVFLAYLWLSGRRRAAAVAVGTAAGLTLLAAALAPGTSRAYWTDALFRPERLGANDGPSNQSLRGMLLRAPLPDDAVAPLWLLLAAVVAVVGLRKAVQAASAGDELLAVGLVGLLAVLCSPVAWMHHLVWLLPLLGALLADGRDPARVRLVAGLAVLFSLKLVWAGHALLRWEWPGDPLWWVLQSSFGLTALGLVLLLRRTGRRGPPRSVPRAVRAGGTVRAAGARRPRAAATAGAARRRP